ncbi:MBL fold metallo-hydrolase [Nesterenkonia cremea]|uniref:Zn-dependent hydrolase n=1 Tax=Nesterenkonia cremea TaxID=1882340 RepID=A0A917ASW4_9MICC|nr:MBL fold metallo-hydrolase [Nesterenkonia cremea]GGE72129.1 Zn-dependent hydrolase [Nesterenkonia cremea]
MNARIEHLETSGTFSLDGETHQVDNNIWIVGDDQEVIVIDPAHDAEAVEKAVGGRTVAAILLTHAHDDHIGQVRDVQARIGGEIHLNWEDKVLWEQVYADSEPDVKIADGDTFTVAGTTLKALHTPGHSPGSTCYYATDLEGGVVFGGDTLFNGGPGATGRSYSSFETIVESIRTVLFSLPEETTVKTGHGPSTTVGAEKPNVDEAVKNNS